MPEAEPSSQSPPQTSGNSDSGGDDSAKENKDNGSLNGDQDRERTAKKRGSRNSRFCLCLQLKISLCKKFKKTIDIENNCRNLFKTLIFFFLEHWFYNVIDICMHIVCNGKKG